MYIIRASHFMVDRNYRPIGNAMVLEVKGNTLKEAMLKFRDCRDNHDLTKSTSYNIYDVINTDEQ